MTLQFDTISVRNFGPFRRIENLDLRTDADAPVVLVYGENTLGKTQLFSALRWCLYGGFLPQQEPAQALPLLDKRFNNLARDAGEDTMEVSLTFTVDSEVYQLTRTAKFTDTFPHVTTDLRVGSSVVPRASIEAEIGKQLHPQISEFFLFDAELMQRFYDRLNTDRERAFIRDSIETVLGIPALQRAADDVSELASHAMQQQATAAKNQSEAEKLQRRLAKLTNEQESANQDRLDLQDTMQKAEAELRSVRDQLRVVDGLQADIREQESLEAQIVSGDSSEAKLREDMRLLLASGWRAPLQHRLQAALDAVQARNDASLAQQKSVARASTRVEVLRERLKGGVCESCGQQLPPPDAGTQSELDGAMAELQRLEEQGGGAPAVELERKINGLLDRTTTVRYGEKQTQLLELQGLQYQRRQLLGQIKDRLAGNDATKIRLLGQQQSRLDDVVESTRRKLTAVTLKINGNNVEINKVARQLDRLPGASPAVVLEANFFGYTRDLLTLTIDRYRERTRSSVEQSASDMFIKLVRDAQGYGGLRIARDFRVELLDTRGDQRETSEGGKQLVALSLIGALKGAAVRGGPVVLDSPLARLDLDHRSNVLRTWIPSLGSQAILLVQSGELTPEEANRILGNRLGREYRIVRPNNDPEDATIERTR